MSVEQSQVFDVTKFPLRCDLDHGRVVEAPLLIRANMGRIRAETADESQRFAQFDMLAGDPRVRPRPKLCVQFGSGAVMPLARLYRGGIEVGDILCCMKTPYTSGGFSLVSWNYYLLRPFEGHLKCATLISGYETDAFPATFKHRTEDFGDGCDEILLY